MSRKLRNVTRFDASSDRVLLAATDPDFLLARINPTTSAGAKVIEVARDGERLVQELVSEDYARTKTGGIDPSRITRSVTRYEWDLGSKRCAWRWQGQKGDRVHLSGTIVIRPQGEGSELETEFELDVQLPLIGGMIERIIAREIEQDLPRFEELGRRIVARH